MDDVRGVDKTIYNFQVPSDVIQCGSELLYNHQRLLKEVQAPTPTSSASSTTTIVEGVESGGWGGADVSTASASSSFLTAEFSYEAPPEEFVDVIGAAETVSQVLKSIGTVVSVAGMMPSAMFAMGVQNSIKAIAECQGMWIPIQLRIPL